MQVSRISNSHSEQADSVSISEFLCRISQSELQANAYIELQTWVPSYYLCRNSETFWFYERNILFFVEVARIV